MLSDHPTYTLEPVGDPYILGLWHKDRISHRGLRDELRTALKSLAVRCDPQKFLIFARARSGTTLLVRLLNQVPSIRCAGEVLHFGVLGPRGHLRRLARTASTPAYGCKLLSYQMVEVQRIREPATFFAGLAADGFRFVHLRRDTFDQCLSLSIAQARSVYHLSAADAGGAGAARIRLDPALFVRQVRWNLELLDLETTIMRDFDHISLDYDRDLRDPACHQATVDRIAAALGVPSGPVSASTRKVLDAEREHTLENYPEIVGALRRAGLDHILPTDAPAP